MNQPSAALITAALLIGTITSAHALDRRVQINNKSDYDIIEFYASSTGKKSWEEDILGKSILPSGQNIVINIDDGTGYCKYDFLAVFADGDKVTSADNNVCEISQFSFTN